MIVIALAVAAFNLSCTLDFKLSTSFDDKSPLISKVKRTVRIDLGAGRWCEGDCLETDAVYAATDSLITLKSEAHPLIKSYEAVTINRESGAYDRWSRINETILTEKGYCERLQFTGFPPKKF